MDKQRLFVARENDRFAGAKRHAHVDIESVSREGHSYRYRVQFYGKNDPKMNIDVKQAPLLQILNIIIEQEPNYVWEIRDGVINFTPVQNRDAFFEKLLNTSIRNFQLPKGNDKFVIKNALVNLPEIKQLLSANGVEVDPFGYPHRPSIYANNADLSDHDTTFRSLLNKIIRESEHNSWVLQWLDKKQKLFEIGL